MDPLGGSGIGESLDTAVDIVIAFGADFFAFIVVAGLIFTFSFYFGRDRLLSLMASIYAAIVLYQAFPYQSFLPGTGPWIMILLFVAFLLAGWVAFSGLSYFLARSDSSGFLGTAVLSIAAAGLLLAVGIHVLPIQDLYTFSSPTLALFASAEMFFLWCLAPLAALFFFGK